MVPRPAALAATVRLAGRGGERAAASTTRRRRRRHVELPSPRPTAAASAAGSTPAGAARARGRARPRSPSPPSGTASANCTARIHDARVRLTQRHRRRGVLPATWSGRSGAGARPEPTRPDRACRLDRRRIRPRRTVHAARSARPRRAAPRRSTTRARCAGRAPCLPPARSLLSPPVARRANARALRADAHGEHDVHVTRRPGSAPRSWPIRAPPSGARMARRLTLTSPASMARWTSTSPPTTS